MENSLVDYQTKESIYSMDCKTFKSILILSTLF